MSVPAAEPGPMTYERLVNRWSQLLRCAHAEEVLQVMLWDAREYAAHQVELCARPDDRWGPE